MNRTVSYLLCVIAAPFAIALIAGCQSKAPDLSMPVETVFRSPSSLTFRYDFHQRNWQPTADQPVWVREAYSIFQFESGPPRLRVTLLASPLGPVTKRAGEPVDPSRREFRPLDRFDGGTSRCSPLAKGGCLILIQPVEVHGGLWQKGYPGGVGLSDLVAPAAVGLDKDGSSWLICRMKIKDYRNLEAQQQAVQQCIAFFSRALETKG